MVKQVVRLCNKRDALKGTIRRIEEFVADTASLASAGKEMLEARKDRLVTMQLRIFILLLPALAHARLGINVDLSSRKEDVNIQLLGEDEQVIDDNEISIFRLSPSPLKDACGRYFGARPSDVYVRSPTPWGDLYQSYGWTQVHRVLKPLKVDILGIHSEPVIIATQNFKNNGTKTAQYKAEITQSVTNTVTNSWSSGHSINVGQDISYEFVIPVGKVGGKTSFSYSHQWGKSGSEAQAVTVGASAGVTVPVEPGDSVMASMSASRGTMELEVTYEVSLYGHVAANYESGYKGHYFWRFDVNAAMEAGGLPAKVTRTEVIKVGFYTDVQIILNERTGDRAIQTFSKIL